MFFDSYFFFSTISRLPALTVLISTVLLSVFLFVVAYGSSPIISLCFVAVASLVIFGQHLALLLYHMAYIVYLVTTQGSSPITTLLVEAMGGAFMFTVQAPVASLPF